MDLKTAIRIVRAYSYYSNPVAFAVRRFIHKGGASGVIAINCLDIGAGTAPYRVDIEKAFGVTHYIAADIAPTDRCNFVGNAEFLPFRDAVLDLVVSFEVVQHVPVPEKMLAEIARVLIPKGHVLLTFPFFYGECDVHDYHRWTMEGMKEDLSRHGFEVRLAQRRGGACFAVTRFLNWAVQHAIPGQRCSWRAARTFGSMLRGGLTILLTLPTNLISWLALFVDHLLPSQGCYVGGAILARKRENFSTCSKPDGNSSAS